MEKLIVLLNLMYRENNLEHNVLNYFAHSQDSILHFFSPVHLKYLKYSSNKCPQEFVKKNI